MSKAHDQRCLDSNRFGDGFDCNCEPDWKALYLAAQDEAAAWKAAHGPFGPQTPAEVAVFEQEAKRVDAEIWAHREASVVELRAMVKAQIDETARARCRIAELEASCRDWQTMADAHEGNFCRLERSIARAVAELENHALPLCSEEGEIEHAVKRALEALR